MEAAASRPLTERQQAVMERIDRRVPIKVIARELGVSETRINQHIRALKDIYSAENLGDLVECYRADIVANSDEDDTENASDGQQGGVAQEALSESAYSKKQIVGASEIGKEPFSNDPGELVMSDVLPLVEQAPWLRPGEPRVVPRVLDGEHAVLFRLAAIVGIAFGVLAAVVLTVTAAITISDALDGRATVPVDEQGFS
ncbi:MAG: helix-turn-helix domain-containing protein [Erythrobacter sp.]